MAVIDMPSSVLWAFGESSLTLNDIRWRAESVWTRSAQEYSVVGSWHWRGWVKIVARTHDAAADLEGWLDQACEAGNLIRMPHPRWRQPRGTLRGSPTVSGGHAAGASQLAIAGLNGQTIKRGDILGVPGHLLRAQEDGTVSGGIVTIGIRGKLRTPLLHGDTVTWNAPTTTFQAQGRPEILYLAGYSPEFTLELVERWV
jgi:hypothetical protein